MATTLLDALAVEIEARHGPHDPRSPMVREWKTAKEHIVMYVEFVGGRPWVVEAHAPPARPCCAPGAVTSADTDAIK